MTRLQTFLVNPLVRLASRIGLGDPADALLEWTARRTGKPLLTPVCEGRPESRRMRLTVHDTGLTLAAATLCAPVALLDSTVVSIALPVIRGDLGAGL